MPVTDHLFSSFTEAEAAIKALGADRMKLGTDRIRQVLTRLNNPQDSIKTIHIVGSNGKGSTSAILASIYEAAGYRVGLFTSPHLVSVRERIQLNRKPISEADFTTLFNRVFTCIQHENIALSYFECLTVIGFLYYQKEAVDIAIIEAGLGGRLDSTNVLSAPKAVVVTPISYDHMALLGETLAEIAAEKVAVFKENVPVITAPQAKETLGVIQNQALACKTKPIIANTPTWQAGTLDFSNATRAIQGIGLDNSPIHIQARLCGAYQCENMAVAKDVVCTLMDCLPVTAAALNAGLSDAFWPGRYQLIPDENLIIDGSHNTAGIETLLESLDSDFGNASGNDSPGYDLHIGLTLLESKPLSTLDKLITAHGKCRIASITALIPPTNTDSTKSFRTSESIAAYCRKLAPNKNVAIHTIDDWLRTKPETGLRVLTGSLYSVGYALESIAKA